MLTRQRIAREDFAARSVERLTERTVRAQDGRLVLADGPGPPAVVRIGLLRTTGFIRR
jgi:hypothetical protein